MKEMDAFNSKPSLKLREAQDLVEKLKDKESGLSECELDYLKSLDNKTSTVKLFHGSKAGLKGTIRPKSRASCDFGEGFYAGDLIYQPQELICEYPQSKMYYVEADLSTLDIYQFYDKELWLMYVARNRGYLTNTPKGLLDTFNLIDSKDVIIGLIADDSMTRVLNAFFSNSITTEVLYRALTFVKLGNQYVFKTQKACDTITVSNIRYTTTDRKNAKQSRCLRRVNIDSQVRDIERQYRREGLYFDELVEKLGGV